MESSPVCLWISNHLSVIRLGDLRTWGHLIDLRIWNYNIAIHALRNKRERFGSLYVVYRYNIIKFWS